MLEHLPLIFRKALDSLFDVWMYLVFVQDFSPLIRV